MRSFPRIRRLPAGLLLALPALLMLSSCGDSERSPTAPSLATLEGTVILGSGARGLRPLRTEIGLSGVTVRVTGTDKAATTDGAGNFTLTGVPAGSIELEFERADIHARGQVTLSSGTHSMTFAIVGSTAVSTPLGHAGEEIEGLVQSMDDGGSLTVLDQRLGAVVVHTDADTLVRRGDVTIQLSDIQIGMRVHVKALVQGDGSYLATEVRLQNERIGGMREVSGTVASVDAGENSFVVQSGGTSVTVGTDGGTIYKSRGSPATFADVVVGAPVQVKGILRADGTILARQVQIEG